MLLQLNFIAAVGLTAVDSPLKKGEQLRQMLFGTALIQVFEQGEDVRVFNQTFSHALRRKPEQTRQAFLRYRRISTSECSELVEENAAKSAAQKLGQVL